MNAKASEQKGGVMATGLMSAVIIDDEPKAIAMMRSLIAEYCPNICVVADAGRLETAIEVLNTLRPQLVFLDVDLTGATGFDLLERIEHRSFHVILVTAHPEFAVKAFRYSVIDYIMKPVDEEELKQAVQKVAELIERETGKTSTSPSADPQVRQTLRIPSMEGARFVPMADIMRLEAQGSYTGIHTRRERFVSSYNLKHFEEHLDPAVFLRIHRSHVINSKQVKAVHGLNGQAVELNDGTRLSVARSYRAAVRKALS
jgi:two-component system, LytTR family, response regulator